MVSEPEIIPPDMPLPKRLRRSATRLFWCGAAVLGIGVLAIIAPGVATVAVETIGAWTLLFVGAAGLAFAWSADRGWSLAIVPGLLVLIGLIFLLSPTTGARVLTILLVIAFVAEGLASLIVGLSLRRTISRGGWLIASGIVSLLAALLIALGWPSTAGWAIGLLVGVNFVTTGLSLMGIAAALRATSSVSS